MLSGVLLFRKDCIVFNLWGREMSLLRLIVIATLLFGFTSHLIFK